MINFSSIFGQIVEIVCGEDHIRLWIQQNELQSGVRSVMLSCVMLEPARSLCEVESVLTGVNNRHGSRWANICISLCSHCFQGLNAIFTSR